MRTAALLAAVLLCGGCNSAPVPPYERQAQVWERTKDCSAQADHLYPPAKRAMAEFTSHYNPSMNKCFILVGWFEVEGVRTKSLEDAFEGRSYGEYRYNLKGSSGPEFCYILSPSGVKQQCASEYDFNKLAETYMGK